MNFLKVIAYLLSISVFLVFSSCQKEESEFIDETDPDTITANSTLANLLVRSSQNPGDFDDLLDGSSCVSINLPVTVIANGQEVIIENEDDIEIVEAIFDQFPNDEDTLEIEFPILVTLANFTEVEVSSQQELDALIASCENDIEDTISCVEFVYPLTFFTFNSNNEQTNTVTINSSLELYNFLDDLDDDDFVSLQFPISVIVNGEEVVVNSNQELVTILANADCGSNDDPVDVTAFEENLTTGVWYVTYFFDDFDETSDFAGYEFTFNTDNTAQATNGSNNVNGTWNLTSGSSPDLDLFFGENDPFDELDEDWDIIEANENIIRLKDISGGDGSTDFLTFERTPNNTGNNETVNNFIEDFTNGVWYVTLFEDNGDDETSDYNGFEFSFQTNGMATGVNGNTTIEGFWTVQEMNGTLNVIFNFSNSGSGSPLGELNDDWIVLEASDVIIRLQDEDSGGDSDKLTFEREPNGGNSPNPQELIDIMTSGTWFVSSYIDDGDDETNDYVGYNYTFMNNNTVQATNGSQTVNGLWVVTVAGDELNFEFDMNRPINGTDDDEYKVLQFNDTSVTFITMNSNGTIEDTLQIQKN